MNNEKLYVKNDETIYSTTRTRTWAYGTEKEFYHGGLQRPFTMVAEQEDQECADMIHSARLTIHGEGPYGGALRPLEFNLNQEDIDGLIKMLSDVKETMK